LQQSYLKIDQTFQDIGNISLKFLWKTIISKSQEANKNVDNGKETQAKEKKKTQSKLKKNGQTGGQSKIAKFKYN
jgi:hypothetical protein